MEIEKEKAKINTIDSRLQSAYKGLEEAKAMEVISMEQIKYLSEEKKCCTGFFFRIQW